MHKRSIRSDYEVRYGPLPLDYFESEDLVDYQGLDSVDYEGLYGPTVTSDYDISYERRRPYYYTSARGDYISPVSTDDSVIPNLYRKRYMVLPNIRVSIKQYYLFCF